MNGPSGISYDNSSRGRMIEQIVEAIMMEKIGNLEWMVAHHIWDAPEDDIKEFAKNLKIKYVKE